MKFQSFAIYVLGTALATTGLGSSAMAQARRTARSLNASSATHVSAEMTKGRLNSVESRPGDKVTIKLKEAVRSNGQVVLKKGTQIEGIVRSVGRAGDKTEGPAGAQAMIEIEWLTPMAQGKGPLHISIALESVVQVNAMPPAESVGSGLPGSPGVATGNTAGGVIGANGGLVSGMSKVPSGTSNAALMSMPNVVAVDSQTTSSLQNAFGTSSTVQLYKVGQGELVPSGGTKHSIEIYSRMSNDAIITSSSRNFEISSGAQMHLLVGVKK